MFEEIYLEVDEEVTSAIDKIKKAKKKNVVLVLPRNAVLGQSIVNLKLVYKEATAQGKEVAMVTTDATTRSLAERIGFMVYDSIKSIQVDPKAKEEAKEDKKSEKKEEKKEAKKEEAKEEDEDKEDSKAAVAGVAAGVAGAAAATAASESAAAGFTSQAVEAASDADSGEALAENNDVPSESESETEVSKESEEPDVPKPDKADQPDPEPREPKPTPQSAPAPTGPQSAASGMIPTRGNLRFFRQQKKRAMWLPLAVVAALIIAGLVSAALIIPTAQVTVTVAAQPFNETVKSSVDVDATALDADKAVIPGKVLTVEHITKSSAKASGKKDMGTKASGTVMVYNEWDSIARTFPAGSKIKAKNGNEFVFTKDTTVPGASSTISGGKAVIVPGKVEAAVEAAAAGDSYNNAATTFTIPSLPTAQQEKIYATSSSAFTGGTSKVVTIVTEQDINTLTENVKTQNKDEAIAEIKKQAADRVVIDKAIQIVSQEATPSAKAEDQVDTVEVSVKGAFSVITFTKQDQQQLLEKVLANKIPEGQVLVTEADGLSPDTSNYELNLVSEKRLELTNNLKAFTTQKFNPDLIRRSLIGGAPSEAKTIASRSVPVESVETKISPAQWPRLPFMASKITLKFVYSNKEKKAE